MFREIRIKKIIKCSRLVTNNKIQIFFKLSQDNIGLQMLKIKKIKYGDIYDLLNKSTLYYSIIF